jgi:Transposase DDE domain
LRHFDEEYVDRVKSYRGTFLYEKALRKRRVWVEPLFAEAKDWHGMRRFRLRRLEKVNIEALLIASGQNVKRLLTFEGHRPRKLAQVAALHPPVATDHRIGRVRQHRSSRSWRPTKAFFNKLSSLGNSVNTTPVYAAEASGWHHGHGVDKLEERRLARRNLYVSREEQSSGPPLPGSAC